MKTRSVLFDELKKRQKKVLPGRKVSKKELQTVNQKGGVVRFSLILNSENGDKKKICFNRVEPNTKTKSVIGIFVAGGSEIDKAVYDANVRCFAIEKGNR